VVIDHPIPNDDGGPRVDAVTELRCRDTFGRYALVEARPRTGRLHQIRRHCKHLSCPLIGDVKLRQGRAQPDLPHPARPARLALHARSSALPHPFGGDPIVADIPLAADMAAAIASCKLAYAAPPAG
jgi:tRNA pseudouridine65 synthase